MTDFNFIPAKEWNELDSKMITFFGSSGHYMDLGEVKLIMWGGIHVATKEGRHLVYNPNASFPVGFKAACKAI